MKKSKKNRYAGSQPEERYGLGTRKSLYLDRPTSHGGWPEGEYDPPINDRIFNYLKDMGLVQEAHLRNVIRGLIKEIDVSADFDVSTPRSRAGTKISAEPTDIAIPLGVLSLSAPKYLGLSIIDMWAQFTDELITGKLQTDTIEFINQDLPKLLGHVYDLVTSDDEDEKERARRRLSSIVGRLHHLLSMWGVIFEPADWLDGIIYALEGEYKFAALSFIFAAPAIKKLLKGEKVLEMTPTSPAVPIVITAINSILNQNVGKELGLVDIDNKLKIEMEKIVESIKTLKTFTIDFSEISDPARKKEIEALADKIESAQVRY
jgi:hypothetical protein